MAYRSFRDSAGTEWQAWDIVPQLAERRAAERRLIRLVVPRERRASDERRVLGSDRMVLGRGMHAGWLCFESLHEKRRLAPVPQDWHRCAIARLEDYLRSAVPVKRSTGGHGQGDGQGQRAG